MNQLSPVELQLRVTSPEGLLRTFAALTHRIHEHDLNLRSDGDAYRAERQLVEAEILRRMAGIRLIDTSLCREAGRHLTGDERLDHGVDHCDPDLHDAAIAFSQRRH